jgi:predicted O-methyltransferase YrrM
MIYPDDVRGWLTLEEAQILRDVSEGRVTLEVGTFCGKSTIILAQVCPLVVTVDWHRGDRNIGPQSSLHEFHSGLQRYESRLKGKVVAIVGRVEDAGPLLAPALFGCIYIDAEHYAPAVTASIRSIEHCAAPGCVWVFHDYHLGDVKRVVRDWSGERDVIEYKTLHGVGVVR